jgi:hypothetical protein
MEAPSPQDQMPEVQPANPPEVPIQTQPLPVENSGKHKPRLKLLIILSILILVLAGAACWYLIKRSNKTETSTTKPVAATSTKASSFTPTKLPNGDTKIGDRTWFLTPVSKPLATYSVLPMSILRCSDGCTPEFDNYAFWQVGKTDGGQDIVLADSLTVEGGPFMFLAKDGKNIVLKKYSSGIYRQDNGKLIYDSLGSNTSEDATTAFPELDLPQKLSIKGKNFVLESQFGQSLTSADSLKNFKDYAASDYGPVSLDNRDTGTDSTPAKSYSASRYVLKTYNFLPAYYQPEPVIDAKAGSISFNDGTKNKPVYNNGFHGCSLGGSYYDVLVDSSASYSQVGSYGADSIPLYALSNQANAEIIKDTFDAYNSFATDIGDDSYPTLSMDQFLAKKPILFFKNSIGQYAALYNSDIILVGGCGKPVIYLYPQRAETVSVKVDADIRISQPNYSDGWKVYARPNGQLSTGGQTYDSLYWEGYGKSYPDITSGAVVSQSELKSTLSSQLDQLGLNAKEKADFLAFWQAKLPSTPYVRLTWFGTNQVNHIAPLHISPAPDTLIRIFLDFEGLNQPINLPAQHLSHLPRKGFTVVEWGGLLRGGLRY